MKGKATLFTISLLGGTALAVSTLGAQTSSPERRRLMLPGGSQIGVTVTEVAGKEAGSADAAGVRISTVDSDSPAAKAGLRAGDLVVEVDGEVVRSARQFGRLIQETADGRSVKLSVVRDGTRQSLAVTPESRPFAFGVDGDRIGREVTRGLREIEPQLRDLEPRLRELEPMVRDFRFELPFDVDEWRMFGGGRGRLGVQMTPLPSQLADYFGAKDGGVLVSSVTAGSAAEKAGLKAGDVITSIDGDRVRSSSDLSAELRDKDGAVSIGILREKKESTVQATLESATTRRR